MNGGHGVVWAAGRNAPFLDRSWYHYTFGRCGRYHRMENTIIAVRGQCSIEW